MLRASDVLYGRNPEEISRLCRVDISTARRWKSGAKCPPQSALLIINGDLGLFDRAWRGWSIQDGKLISQEGWAATPGDVLAIQLTQMQLATYRAELRQIKALPDQPLPAEIPAIK
jgi:hypothetical protein